MNIREQLSSSASWESFLAWRLKKGRFNWREFEAADEFVDSGRCVRAGMHLIEEKGLCIPTRILVNKMGSQKKRVVYCYEKEEMEVLKFIAHSLYRYDSILAPNCYSFRQGQTVQSAIFCLMRKLAGRQLWVYKIDIHNYFNSVSIPRLLPILKDVLSDDGQLYSFFEKMLTNPFVRDGENVIEDEHGIMAGTPTAPFMANIYLREMDYHFYNENVIYARYSDDIILFASDRETLVHHIATLNAFLQKYRLQPNPDKEQIYAPDEAFDFLGYKCNGNKIGLADATILKMKGKIRRKARSLYRWRTVKGKTPEDAMKALISFFNRKFFESEEPDQLNWSRWFFPVINDVSGLRVIDHYLQQNIRYAATGKNNGANYRIRYKELRSYGYRSLVSEYYLRLDAENSKPHKESNCAHIRNSATHFYKT